MAVAKVAYGAYRKTVVANDGSDDIVMTFSDFLADEDNLTLVSVAQGAYTPQIENSAGDRKSLVDHVKTPGGETIAKVASKGYNSVLLDDNGDTLDVGKYYETVEAAAAVLEVADEGEAGAQPIPQA